MRGLYLVLLVVLLGSDHALSLQCYFCAGSLCHVMTCGQGQNVCYKSDLIMTFQDGGKVSVKQGGCAPSCELPSSMTQTAVRSGSGSRPLEQLFKNVDVSGPTVEVQGVSCCDKDLCNGVSRAGRSLWALAGGLLLSLGPALLWALL